MREKYRSGFERLAALWRNTDDRYAMALRTVKANFSGFRNSDGFDARRPDKLTPAQRKQIRRYYNLYTSYTEGTPVYIMPISELPKRIRKDRKNINATMSIVGMSRGQSRAKKLFIRYDGENLPRVSVRNDAPVLVNDALGYSREIIIINQRSLVADPVGTIEHAARKAEGARFYRIVNINGHEFFGPRGAKGAPTINITNSPTLLGHEIERLMLRYPRGTKDSYEKWLYGFAAYYTDRNISDVHKDMINMRGKELGKRIKAVHAKIKADRKANRKTN